MPRPTKCRRICNIPERRGFVPTCGARGSVTLTIDEYEVIRLLDHEGLNQSQCALQMNVARTTITKIYDSARRKIADSLVNNKAVTISGGDYIVCEHSRNCCGHCGFSQCGNCNNNECHRCEHKED